MTSQFAVSGLVKTYGSNVVVDQLDLEIEHGEFLVLLGPSGCGKTTTLRCLAGLETPQGGSISFRGAPVFDAASKIHVPAHKRSIGMVFQSYALWPHMTVAENIRYPLKVRKLKKAIADGAVEAAAEMVDCGKLLDRYPSQLSGGQQQRVAVARGLVAEPDLVLFDEPLSNLDARLRDQVRSQIHQLHQTLGFTAVFVTHDQSEAFALGDRLAIMKSGKIEQYDAPEDVFENPVSEYVAAFIGMGNRLELRNGHNGWVTSAGDVIDLSAAVVRDRADQGSVAVARFRPDDVMLHASTSDVPAGNVPLHAQLVAHEYGGRYFDVTVKTGTEQLMLRASAAEHGRSLRSSSPGDDVVVSFSPSSLRVYPGAGSEPAATPDLVATGAGDRS
ncbi:ABC transporter ATP-binding protein [Rhodococcus sp. BP-252]|uniref:ABC transporter ATP-binding protein n=1 Tax=unclassified Rhodococcus (in: high G+C Gram-positive bacteria) TaxID=192944 RepID=UPI0014316DF9|nr:MULTISPECIES: ABC transporter ATP-binding protein [unclassified Rhodococcus (in: high G+C Gram-positive bacteria)]MBY6412190.1 ABC transporter ATP-binding protein [Rhodococcus sp. BP-320]MBY6416770.1 ABC transporter ATP-binding protein [Rhodococcus sp. BP-321]MBY6421041.1 ABC transporter ATP-binding protein [Rhodococcus sp. BP-324]MBY6426794.1 ABC transporter ATP-binding protein [Rhodococcus sp. BP-323]MBY6431793.1 ABC transporter ATP-binding protein [Rhodococcus sp. BP-322]